MQFFCNLRLSFARVLRGFFVGVVLATSAVVALAVTVPPAHTYWKATSLTNNTYASAEDACSSAEFANTYGAIPTWGTFDHAGPFSPYDSRQMSNGKTEYMYPRMWCTFKLISTGELVSLTVVNQMAICPSGFTWSGWMGPDACFGDWVVDPKNSGNSCPKISNPINPAIGSKYQIESDYVGTGSLSLNFQRTYNAGAQIQNGALGSNWSSTFDRSIGLYLYSGYNYALVYRPDGRILHYTWNNGIFTATGDITDKLIAVSGSGGTTNGYQYISSLGDEVETYDVNGKLLTIVARSGLTQTMSYDDQGRLSTVTDSFGHHLTLTYDGINRVASLNDPNGATYQYTYDAQGNLATVVYPGGATRIYHYNEPAYMAGTNVFNALTGITDENGARYATYQYDATGKAVSTEHAGGADKASLSYTANSTVVTDPLGTSRTYNFQTILGVVRSTGISQPGGAGCSGAASNLTYDANGNVASRTDFNGAVTTYSYDMTRNLETRRVEGSGTPQARTITTAWHVTYSLPLQIAEPKLLTTYAYDTSGNLLSKTVQATSDATGAQGLSPTLLGTARNWSYTYNTVGQVLTATGPRADVADKTTYTYDASGNLSTITNAVGQLTTLSNYDANGRVGLITDANGATTTLTYSPRGWLTGKTVTSGGTVETTAYGYDSVGQLTLVTLPNTSTVSYTYDPAHRLTNIADSLGNSIAYTLDNMGNRINEQVKDPSGALARQTSRVVDALDRIQQITGAVQ